MYNGYVKNGGEDREVMQYFQNLEKDMKKFEEKTLLGWIIFCFQLFTF